MSRSDNLSVRVIVVHFNVPEELAVCLDSFDRFPPHLPFRMVVVDNSASFSPLDDFRDRYPHVTLLEMEKNIGFSAACNRAAEGAQEEYLFFLNPDTEIRKGSIDELVGFLERTPEAGIVGPLNVGPSGDIQDSCRRFPTFKTALGNKYSLLTRLFPANALSSEYLMTDIDRSAPQEVDWVSGAALLMARKDFEALGGFDEDFFLYSEDVDLCYRLGERGRKVFYYPLAAIQHKIGGSSGKKRFRALWERHRSMYVFYRKHYSLDIPLVDFTTLLGITLRGVFCMSLEALGFSPHR